MQPVLRFLLAALSLPLSLQGGAAVRQPGRTGLIQSGTRKLIDGRDRPDVYAVLTSAAPAARLALRTGPEGGGPGLPLAICLGVREHGAVPGIRDAELQQYRLQNAHIVRAQSRALFPKHWFW